MVDHAEYIIGVFDNQKKLRSGTAPVSYTHLDVYKRQRMVFSKIAIMVPPF